MAECRGDADWGVEFRWCSGDDRGSRSLTMFDCRLWRGREAPGSSARQPTRDRHLCVRERAGRQATGCLVGGQKVFLPLKCVKKRPKAPRCPALWNAQVEVPFGMKVGTPLPARIWGVHLLDNPCDDRLWRYKPEQWAVWCAVHTIFAQDAAEELLDSLFHGILWYLPPRLVRGMHEIGLEAFVGRRWQLLERVMLSTSDIRWDRVDPASGSRPAYNLWRGPIYHTGDAVLWDKKADDR